MYIIGHEVAEYHQCRALYIIITEFFCTLKRDDIQKRAIFSLFLMICTQTSCVMICHYSVMDKKSRIKIIRLFWSKWRDSNPRPPAPETGALPTALHLVKFCFIITKFKKVVNSLFGYNLIILF